MNYNSIKPESLSKELTVFTYTRFNILSFRKILGIIPIIQNNFKKLIYKRKYIWWYKLLRKIKWGFTVIRTLPLKIIYKIKNKIYN